LSIIIGPIPVSDPQEAVLAALRKLEPNLESQHVQVCGVRTPPSFDTPVWHWEMEPSAPPVRDTDVTVHEAEQRGNHWAVIGEPTNPTIDRGIAIETDNGWMVGSGDEDIDTAHQCIDLAESIAAGPEAWRTETDAERHGE
jgi:hypothetical protein